jgi:hypothetical protein
MAFQVLHLLLNFIFSDQYFWFSLFNTFVLSRFKQPNVLSSQMLCRHHDDEYLIPREKMIELNFAISNNFAKTSTSSGENTHEEKN